MYTLDTNAIIYYMKGDKNAVNFLDGIFVEDTVFYISAVTELELFAFSGLTKSDAAYIEKILQTITIIPLDSRIAKIAGTIRSGFKIGTADSAIAATALATGSSLVTRNVKDFKNVPGLSVLKI